MDLKQALKMAVAGSVLAGASIAASGQAVQQIAFRSHTPQDYSDILSGRYKDLGIDISGQLVVPPGSEKVPAVVIVPGSSGVQSWMQSLVAKRLNDAGIATLIIDSFTPRGVGQTATDQSTVPMAASVIDGFAALKALSQRGDIDARRIGITGFSRGGTVALFTQHKAFQEALGLGDLQFAAHLPFYPACSTTVEFPQPTSAPSLILMGEKDDYTPAAQCMPYIERVRAAGGQVQSRLIPEAHHGWVSDAASVVYLPRIRNFSNCSALIGRNGVIKERVSGATSEQGWKNFASQVWRACGKYGANYGATEPARENSLAAMVNFFSQTLKVKP